MRPIVPHDDRHLRRVASSRDHDANAPSILCVDDHVVMLHTLTRLLGREGWRVETATDAKLGLIRARAVSFDALVVDLKLPGMSGLDLIKALRREGIHTPAILLTGFPSINTAIEATNLGIGYLLKREMNDRSIIAEVRALLARTAKPSNIGDDPVRRAIQQLIELITSKSGSALAVSAAASRSFASLLCDRELSFRSFIIAAATLRAVLDSRMAHGELVEFLQEQAAKLSRRHDASADALLDCLLSRVEAGGIRWATVKKDDAAQLLETDARGFEKALLSSIHLSWSQFRRAVVTRAAVASLAHDDEYVSQMAYRLGYDRAGVFDRDFHLFLGVTPTAYRRLTAIQS